MFQFTALAGAQSNSRASQSILELDGGVKVLVDVGWDDRFDTRQLAELEKHVSTLSFILLTHATISHLGAYAHCCKHIPLFSQVPVYATAPVIAFGRTTLQDLYSSAPTAATFIPLTASPEDESVLDDATRPNILQEAPTFEQINSYFSNINPLKYSQPHQPAASYFSAPLEGLTLTAYNAGHTLGGTIWHIQHGMESIVYAVDWHQARENVIAGAAWFDGIGGSEVSEALRKPTALICSSANGDKVALAGGRKARDEALLGHIRSSLSKGGSVLIPTDSSARILELAWLLEKTWQEGSDDEYLQNARVYMATKSAHATLRHARSLLEWMDDSIVREFEGDDENTTKSHKRSRSKQNNSTAKMSRPFEFKHVKIIETANKLDRILKGEGPRVIVASDLSGEWGYSRASLEHIAQKPENLVILTERVSSSNTHDSATASTLWQWHQERANGVALDKSLGGDQIEQVHTGGLELVLRDSTRAPLDEAELARYQQYMAAQQQLKDSLLTSDGRQLADAEEVMNEDDESSSESEDEEDDQQGRALNVSAALTHGNRNKVALSDEDLGVSILIRKKDVFDYDVRNKKGRNAVFPYAHSRRRGDEFGEFIKPEDFLREEEKEAQEAMQDEKNNSVLGQKRKWSEDKNKQTKPTKKLRQLNDETSKRTAEGDDMSSDDSDSEVEMENIEDSQKGPSKVVYEEKKITFHARLAFVDFAGVHDQRSLQMLIPLINPKKLILIGGSAAETAALANDCSELLGMKVVGQDTESKAEIYSPNVGELIDASVDTNAWTVKLTRDLVKRLHWQNVKNMSIVTISAQLRTETVNKKEEGTAKKLKLEDQAKTGLEDQQQLINLDPVEPVLDALPASVAASTRVVTQPIHVGDLRLADLRRLMRENGHSANFRGEGTLLVDEMVAVRKLASGKIVVEGPPINAMQRSDSFNQVKRRIYDGLAVVAAG